MGKCNNSGKTNLIIQFFEIDKKAKYFFENFRFDNGNELPSKNREKYILNASVLNTIMLIQANPVLKSQFLKDKSTGFWKKISFLINLVKDDLKHNLPSNERRLKDVYFNYLDEGYNSLISKTFGSQNSRKVDERVLRLLDDIAKQVKSEKPTLIKENLDSFLKGEARIQKTDGSEDYYENKDFAGLSISRAAIKDNCIPKTQRAEYTAYKLLKREMNLSNNFYESFSKLDLEVRIKLFEQFISIIDLVKKN